MKKQKLNKEFKDGVWYKPKMKGFIHECCDCGLKHKIDFKVFYDDKENPIEFRWNRVNTEQKPNNLSLCQSCMCMTKTIKGKCGKCGVVKQNKDREEFMARYEGANTVQSSISSFMANDIWQWIETHTKKKVEEAYKKGISDVEKNIEYNAQTKVWEIPEEKLLSIQSNKKRNKREIKTIMKYEFTRKEIIERKRNADYNAYELDYIQKQINAVKKQQVEGKITPQQAQKRIDSLNRWLHEQNWKCEQLEKLLIPNQ